MAASEYIVSAANLRAMADAIREKTGQAGLITPNQMAAAIAAIPGGGGVTVEPLSATENGIYTAPEGTAYSPVTVNVGSGVISFNYARSLNLSNGALDFPAGSVVAIDCTFMTGFANLANGGYHCPGYEEIRLTNLPTASSSFASAFGNHIASGERGFKRLVLDGDLIIGACANMFTNNRTLTTISGGKLNFSNAINATSFMDPATALVDVSVVPSSIKDNIRANGPYLSAASVVSFINGLDETVSGKTITLNSAIKAGLSGIIGTVTDGLFTIDAGGDTNLLDFATNVKGWTVA